MFNVPSTIIVAGGASQQLAAQAERLDARRALLVTDTTMVASGLAKRCVDQLAAANIPATVFAGVSVDPHDRRHRQRSHEGRGHHRHRARREVLTNDLSIYLTHG